jgi:hypothetical protein
MERKSEELAKNWVVIISKQRIGLVSMEMQV